MSQTRSLAEFVARMRYEDLPQAVIEQACRIVADTVGCAISAWAEDPGKSRVALEIAKLYRTDTGASVIGVANFKSQPAFAALANGILSNAADNDDTHKRALLHTGSVVVPPVLALAEAIRMSGRDLIVSLVAGYEVAVRVGMAVMPTHYRFWHSTATNGTFGAAASAAKALGLDADGVQRTLGLAGTQAAGLNTFFESGDMTKSIHPGKAALNGILSAQLAQIGATSPPTILEHPKGYLNAYSTDPKPQALVAGLGSTWEILQNGFKFYPTILASHSPIQATLAIVRKHAIDPKQIARITNETYNTVKTHFSNQDVTGVMSARVSVPYCIAISAIDRELTQAQFALARINDPLVREVLARTEVIADAELNKLYPDKFPARVTIHLKNGTSLQETVLYPKGDPQDPLTADDLEAKFRGNVAAMLNPGRAGELLDAIYALPGARNMDHLMSLLHG
ncbi:MAG: MmgE/PrpD family protein [Betaproteobacteria bacterium]|nr:MmgE/PrpD family protein [Betaproteobacteria bacterium]MBI3052816.1 MmgE/PrpD family protein [Betaproteobacteria bacterium]